MTMKKIIFSFLLINYNINAQSNNIYGLWVNQDHEFVRINPDSTFTRFSTNNEKIIPLAYGKVYQEGGELRIIRKDTIDAYNLCYYVGNETMVICRPRSKKAWLWSKLGEL
jgi:hypothetical protein